MGTKTTWYFLLLLILVMGCGSLDDSDLLDETIAVDLVLKNPDESARGTAKAVDGLQPDFAVSKASATLGVSSCNICCGSVCKDVSFSNGASEVTTSLSCTAGHKPLPQPAKIPTKPPTALNLVLLAKRQPPSVEIARLLATASF